VLRLEPRLTLRAAALDTAQAHAACCTYKTRGRRSGRSR
jgi:hypothetical protein